MKIFKQTLILIAIVFAAINCSAQKSENFTSFWKSFTNDSVFQKERIVFPLTLTYFDYDENDEDLTEVLGNIPASDWQYDNFIDEEAKITINKQEDFYTVVRAGIENGIYVEYTFKLNDNKWYLVKIADSSN